MSKIIDLTGLATAIQNIKNWVNLQISSVKSWVQTLIESKTQPTHLTYTDQNFNDVSMTIDGTSETAIDIRNISAHRVKQPLTIIKGDITSSYDGSDAKSVGFESIVEDTNTVTVDRGEIAANITPYDFEYSAELGSVTLGYYNGSFVTPGINPFSSLTVTDMTSYTNVKTFASLEYTRTVTVNSKSYYEFKIKSAYSSYRSGSNTIDSSIKEAGLLLKTEYSIISGSSARDRYDNLTVGTLVYISADDIDYTPDYWPKDYAFSTSAPVSKFSYLYSYNGSYYRKKLLLNETPYMLNIGVEPKKGYLEINNITYFNKGVSFADEHVQINGVNIAPNVYTVPSDTASEAEIDISDTCKYVFDSCTVTHTLWLPDPAKCNAGISIYLHIVPNSNTTYIKSRGVYNDDGSNSTTGLAMHRWAEGSYQDSSTQVSYTKGGIVYFVSDGFTWWGTRFSESY